MLSISFTKIKDTPQKKENGNKNELLEKYVMKKIISIHIYIIVN